MARLFKFEATAGTRVFMDSLGYDGYQPVWRLLDPTGAAVRSVAGVSDVDVQTLTRTGTYKPDTMEVTDDIKSFAGATPIKSRLRS